MADEHDISVLTAMRHIRSNEWARAASVLEALLAGAPDQRRGLVLLGLVRAEQSDCVAAEALFARAVRLAPEDDFAWHMLGDLRKRQDDAAGAVACFARAAAGRPDFAPNHNALGVALQLLGRHEMALRALDRAVGLDPLYARAWFNRGALLEQMRAGEAATLSFRRVLAVTPACAADWEVRGLACVRLDELDAAAAAARAALAVDPRCLAAHALLAEVLERQHRLLEAASVRAELGRRQRVVRQPCFAPPPRARILLVAGSALCNIPTEYILDRGRFEVTLLHLAPYEAPGDHAALLRSLPPFDMAFNVIGDADSGTPFLDRAASFCADLACPVLNPPARIPPTRRDRLPALLGDIPGLVVPHVRRLGRAAVADLARDASAWPMPWLIRPAGSHGGVDLRRIEAAAGLADYLTEVPAQDYYLSVFWDYRSVDGLYRKARFVFVDRAAFPYHLAICQGWLAHYWRADMTPPRLAEEAAFLADPATVFPTAAMLAVREVARRLDLDFGGIDCALLPDGRVLLFEANATMLVHLPGCAEDAREAPMHVPAIRDAVSRLVLGRLANAPASMEV